MKTDIQHIPAHSGFVFDFTGHGAFDPCGKVADSVRADEVAAHNRELAAIQVEAMRAQGCAVLYLTGNIVSTWEGSRKWPVNHSKKSWHNMAGRDGRTDVWFTFEGQRWHGVNIGDNQILRCKRCKR